MNEEEKNAIEYLKNRLYGNEDCKYIDVAQEDLRVFIKLIEKLQKENEELKNDYENLSNSVVVKNHYIKNSIPIQKVKDLIEELKENGYWNYLEERDLETTIEILKKIIRK